MSVAYRTEIDTISQHLEELPDDDLRLDVPIPTRMKPTVSVIIPSYQRPALADVAVRSVLAQTHPVLEVLLVLDSSDVAGYDGIEQRVGSDRLRVIRPMRHLGLTGVKNLGIAEAEGDVIGFLDDDDHWYPWKLRSQLDAVVAALGTTDRPFVSATAFHAAAPSWVERWPGRDPEPDEPVGDFLLTRRDGSRHHVLQASTYLCHRSVAEAVPFRGKSYEDWDWLIRASRRFPFVFSPRPGGQFRIASGTMTSTTTIDEAMAWYHSIEADLTEEARSGFHATLLPRLVGRDRDRGQIGPMVRGVVGHAPSLRETLALGPRLLSAWRSAGR